MSLPTKYTQEVLERAVCDSLSVAEVLRKLGLKWAGGTQAHITRRIKALGLDTKHFLGQGRNRGGNHLGGSKTLSWQEVLVYSRTGKREATERLRRAMIEAGVPHHCAFCPVKDEWNGRSIVLAIDHKDGDFLNNAKDNLRFLCPNCHSQTLTFGTRNLEIRKIEKERNRKFQDNVPLNDALAEPSRERLKHVEEMVASGCDAAIPERNVLHAEIEYLEKAPSSKMARVWIENSED